MAHVLRQSEITLVEMDAEYDALGGETLRTLTELLLELAETADPPIVLLDMTDTRYIGSSFLETLFRAWRRLSARQGQLALCGVQPFCGEVFKVTGLQNLWPMYATRDEGLAALAPSVA